MTTKLGQRPKYEPELDEGATIKLIGAGGIGGIVARYGVLFTAALVTSLGRTARWVMVDGDEYETKNRARMAFSRYGNKAEVLCDELLPLVADSRVALIPIPEYVTPENVARLIREGDMVLLAVDNHRTRKLISDHCEQHLRHFCIISAGNDGVGDDADGRWLDGTYASCQVFARGRFDSPSLGKHHPELARPADKLPTELSCTELVSSQPQILFANLAAASALLNTWWLYLCDRLHYSEIGVDIGAGLMRPILGVEE